MAGAPVAAIDCGTNSTRLLIAGPQGETRDRRMRITRLGQGVDQAKALAPEAIERTLAVLREYRQAMDAAGVARCRMTATSAARDAANRDDFFAAAEAVVGTRPELLGGDEEARLSFAGATASLDPSDGPFLVVDIGGGSTEFAVGPAPEGDALTQMGVASIDVGCVRLTERFLHADPPRAEELAQALDVVNEYLDDVRREIPEVDDAQRLVGLAGTVSTVAAVEIGLAEYDPERIHHFVLTKDAVEDVFRTLAMEKRADRVFNPGLEAARADVIVGGCVVLVAIMRHFGFRECLVSEQDILDGLVMSLLGEDHQASRR
ncbi:MAG: exopolyphosphatase / guanosine-5-triphosphate,3-diphosphate pyrophosphatase [Acidimicrobiaceae bacterium]|jgi:exopolyphosphatase/guanosine-5'-triphosphate,3'-diphosphate pyrophosphatase|nr:exopolyphosphatase / guanosine-5-triphosphate,3-diphosphate pyrophosphatase [Acidimicrobiaceae bacterium]